MKLRIGNPVSWLGLWILVHTHILVQKYYFIWFLYIFSFCFPISYYKIYTNVNDPKSKPGSFDPRYILKFPALNSILHVYTLLYSFYTVLYSFYTLLYSFYTVHYNYYFIKHLLNLILHFYTLLYSFYTVLYSFYTLLYSFYTVLYNYYFIKHLLNLNLHFYTLLISCYTVLSTTRLYSKSTKLNLTTLNLLYNY